MPTVDLALQKELKKRTIVLTVITIITACYMVVMLLFTMSIYGFSLSFAVPFILIVSLLGIFGFTFVITQFFGLYMALRPVERDRFNPINKAIDLKEDTRIAVIMPIYHEDARRVAGAFSAMIEELSHYKEAKHFDWFILSDTRKEDVIVQEQKAVLLLKEKFPEVGIHYRHRIMNTFAKVGNTSDFFRRWGKEFKAVIILDADSMVPAETMVIFARTMEGDDNIGIIQAMPYAVNSTTLFAKLFNFANVRMLLGFSAAYYFKMGRSPYLGHNTIVRSEAIMKHCNLPIFKKKGPFDAGKPSSHDFVEAMLLEAVGYQVWVLPTLVSFEEQIQNFVDYMIREKRWFYGAMNWFRLLKFEAFSTFGTISLLFYAMNYFLALTGLVFFIITYLGTYYMLAHPLMTFMVVSRYHNILMLSAYLGGVLFLTGISLPIIVLWKRYRHNVSIVKTIFSQFVGGLMGMIIGPYKMLFLNRLIWGWFKKSDLVWVSQNRVARVLSWEESFKFSWPVSVFGLGCAYFFLFYIMPLMPGIYKLTGVELFPFFLFVCIPILGLIFCPVVVRFMSRSFPLVEKMGWFKHQFEGANEYPVVRETRKMTSWFGERVSETYSFEQALSDPYFALRHLAQCPSRPQKYAFWKDKLSGRNIQDLTRLEKLVVFRCRELWEMFMTKNFHVSKEKTQ